MPDSRRAHCRNCRSHRDICGPISWAGYCSTCGKILFAENLDSLHEKAGPPYERWHYALLQSVVGPRVAYALKQAGVLEPEPEPPSPPRLGEPAHA